MSFFIFIALIPNYVFLAPSCQAINRDDMEASSLAEETFKLLIEKCDMYDNIDALLDLKGKYSLYELDQLKKEMGDKQRAIGFENLEKFREKRISGNKV
jgi:hypothetical protein